MVARSRQAEATVSLATIHDLQKSYYYEDDRGYYHSGLHYGIDKCAAGNPREAGNELGFKLPDCTKARYRYLTNKGNDCAVSDGAMAQGQVYPGCNANDEWAMNSVGKLTHVHDVVSKCPLGLGSSPSATCVQAGLPTPPPAPLVAPASPSTPPAPAPPPPPTCDHSFCWLLADNSCVKCGIVGGIKTTVPCSTCKIPKPYVYKPAPPPTVFVAPPSPPDGGGGHNCDCHSYCGDSNPKICNGGNLCLSNFYSSSGFISYHLRSPDLHGWKLYPYPGCPGGRKKARWVCSGCSSGPVCETWWNTCY